MIKEDKAPNTIAVFRDDVLWARFGLNLTKEQFTVGLTSEIGKFLADDDISKLILKKYYDDRVK